MVLHLMIKEVREQLYGGRLLWYGLTCVFLITFSFMLGTMSYAEKQANYAGLTPDLENQTYTTAWRWRLTYHMLRFSEHGVDVALKPPVLQALVRGTEIYQNTILPVAMYPWYESRFPFVRHEKIINPQEDFMPPADFTLICTFLLSVLVLIFSYNAVSRERERGTLKMVLASPVSRAHVLLAKLAGGYLAVILPVFISFILCLLIAQTVPFYSLGAMDTVAFALIFGYAALYLLVLYAIGILVSTAIKRSSTSLAVVLLVWLVFIVVFHNGALIILRNLQGSEPLFTVIKKLENTRLDHPGFFGLAQKVYGKHFQSLTGAEQISLYREGVAKDQKENLMPVLADHIAQVEKDMRIIRVLQFISPSLLLEGAVSEMAGTGIRNYLYTMRSLYDYLNYFRENVATQAEIDLSYADISKYLGRYHNLPRDKQPPLIYEEFRKFNPGIIALDKRIEATIWNAFAFICYAVFFFMAAFYAFIKTEIT